jgi:hypothetical protein
LKLHHPLAGPIIGTRREVAHIRTLMRNIILAGGVVVLVVAVFIMVVFLKMIISLSSLGGDRYENHYYETPRQSSSNRNHHQQYNNDCNRVVVKNMSYDTDWRTLKDHLRKCGEILRVDLMHDEKGRSRGIG